jgi:hypothetical protein
MISYDIPSVSFSEHNLPSIQHHTSTSSNQDSITSRQHARSLSLPASIQLPKLTSPKVISKFSPSERIVYEAYQHIYSLNSQVTEKGNFHTELALYLMNVSSHKPIYMNRADWSSDQISQSQAINSFKCYFDYMDDSTNISPKRKESANDFEIEAFARLYEQGDSEKVGWDKSDVFDFFGKKSPVNAYYLIEKQAIKGKNRLQFSEFLKYCLPEHKKFDASSVNRFYDNYHKRRSSFVRCTKVE